MCDRDGSLDPFLPVPCEDSHSLTWMTMVKPMEWDGMGSLELTEDVQPNRKKGAPKGPTCLASPCIALPGLASSFSASTVSASLWRNSLVGEERKNPFLLLNRLVMVAN